MTVARMMSMERTAMGWFERRRKKGSHQSGIEAKADVFSKPWCDERAEPCTSAVVANAWHLATYMRDHLQCTKPVNTTPTVIDTQQPAV